MQRSLAILREVKAFKRQVNNILISFLLAYFGEQDFIRLAPAILYQYLFFIKSKSN